MVLFVLFERDFVIRFMLQGLFGVHFCTHRTLVDRVQPIGLSGQGAALEPCNAANAAIGALISSFEPVLRILVHRTRLYES